MNIFNNIKLGKGGIFGVCSGLGKFCNVSSDLFRIIFIVLIFYSSFYVYWIAYIILLIFTIINKKKKIKKKKRNKFENYIKNI